MPRVDGFDFEVNLVLGFARNNAYPHFIPDGLILSRFLGYLVCTEGIFVTPKIRIKKIWRTKKQNKKLSKTTPQYKKSTF